MHRTCREAIGALAFAFALLACTSVARADWNALGDSINPGPITYWGMHPDVADVGGTPYVAWVERNPELNRNDIRVARWTGSIWEVVGQPLNGYGNVSPPSITTVGGVPYVAFVEFPTSAAVSQVYVSKLNGAGDGWVDVGGGPINHDPLNGDAQEVSIAPVGSVLYVAFTEGDAAAPNLWVKKLQSGTWEAVGGQLNVNPVNAFFPEITGIGGDPYLTWVSDGDPAGMYSETGLRVSRFNGSSWAGVGGRLRNDLSGGGHLADVGGVPTILFSRQGSGDTTTQVVQQWNGTSWSDLGGPLNDPEVEPSYGDGSIAAIDGAPYVAIPTSSGDTPRIRVLTYDGAGWTQVGSTLRRNLANPYEPVIAAVGDGAVVTWREQADSVEKIHASQFGLSFPPAAPETTITGDSTATRAGVGSYAFTAQPPDDATFECSWDDEPFEPCISPHQSGVLDPGNHNFRVRASNAGGTDPTPASRDFIVDREAPTVTIRLDGSRTSLGAFAGSVTVNADVTDPPLSSGPRSTFCLVDPLTPPTSFGNFGSQPCGVVVTALGSHTAYAIANDQAGNESAIVNVTFSIVAAPDTTITDGPSGVVFSVPSFRFTSNVAGARFECRVDSGPYTACSSAILAYKVYGLSQGTHTFEVRAIGPDGLVDPSPASRTFTLGTQALDGGCSFRFPFRGNDDGLTCVAKRAVCPLGSVCTRVGEVNVGNEDIGISYGGAVSYALSEFSPGGSTTRLLGVDNDCWAPSFGGTFTGPPCPQTWTNTVLGKGQSIAILCGTWRMGNYSSPFVDPIPGPDEARGILCNGTITIRPATALEAGATGTGPGMSIVVPGPGILGVAPLAVARSSAAGLAAPKPPFKTITGKKIKGEGVAELKLNLGPAERKTLRTERRLELTLDITFTPTGGESISRTQTVVLTTRCKPTKKRPFC